MDTNIIQQGTDGNGSIAIASPRTFLARVFSYMAIALVISGGVAWWFAHDPSLLSHLIDPTTGRQTFLGWAVLLSPIGLVMLMGGMVQRMSVNALFAVFVVYSAITGMSLSYIFLAYTAGSIATTFFLAAAVFGIMAVMGYTTRTDLTRFGSIMMVGLMGVVVASLVNFFIQSTMVGYIVSIVGVLVFTGLTAWDMQKLKAMSTQVAEGTAIAHKMSLMGALTLYLDFINLFLLLLRLFGGRRN